LLVVEVEAIPDLVEIYLAVLVAVNIPVLQVLLPGKVIMAVLAADRLLFQEAVEVALERLALKVVVVGRVLVARVYPTLLRDLLRIMLVVVVRQGARLQPAAVPELVEMAQQPVQAEQVR
jgi:hypothetical protein